MQKGRTGVSLQSGLIISLLPLAQKTFLNGLMVTLA